MKKMLCPGLLASIMLLVCFSAQLSIGKTDDASLKLQNANVAIEQAFNGVLSAEKAGSNVTGLIGQLNVANGLLAQAENSYRSGNINATADFAEQAIPVAQQVRAQAIAKEESASVASQRAFEFAIVSTVIGSILFVLGLFLVWRYFKKRYISDLLESNPEVADN